MSLTSNIRLLDAPGNVLVPAKASGLARDSVVNVSQILTVDRDMLTERVNVMTPSIMKQVDKGLRFALDF